MNSINITKYIESKFPTELMYDWDNVGLQVGTLNSKVKRVLVALDVTKNVVKEAIELKVDLLITHHPLMFKPMKNIIFDSPKGWIIKNLIQHNISVYSAHTNFDQGIGGMNDILAKEIGINNPKLLDKTDNIGRFGEISPIPLKEFVEILKDKFKLPSIKVIGNLDKIVKIVGVSGGSGSHHMYAAKKRNCSVYITGDVTYHTALDAVELGITILDVGHHVEVIFVNEIIKDLSYKFPEIEFIESKINTNPYHEV